MGTDHEHRVCTYQEAEEAIRAHDRIYVNDCFCRGPARDGQTKWEYCGHPVETCMGFAPPKEGTPFAVREIPPQEALARMDDWKGQGNFFRFMEGTGWVCFCCGCGCAWFRDESGARRRDRCAPSPFIERTDAESCTLCGACVEVCAWEARVVEAGRMAVASEFCSGCSACAFACAEGAVTMVLRATGDGPDPE